MPGWANPVWVGFGLGVAAGACALACFWLHAFGEGIMTEQERRDVRTLIRRLDELGPATPAVAAASFRLGLTCGAEMMGEEIAGGDLRPILSREELAGVLGRRVESGPDVPDDATPARAKAMGAVWRAMRTAVDCDELELASVLHSAHRLAAGPDHVMASAYETMWGYALQADAPARLAAKQGGGN